MFNSLKSYADAGYQQQSKKIDSKVCKRGLLSWGLLGHTIIFLM